MTYFINYFTHFRTYFVQEVTEHYKPVLITVPASLVVAYLYVAIVLSSAHALVLLSSAVFPLLLIAAGVALILVATSKHASSEFDREVFGFVSGDSVQWILLLIAIILFAVGALFLLRFLSMMEVKMKLSNNIRLCLDVFRRRKWMIFHPIIFVVVLCIHVGLCVAAIGGTLASSSFDS